MQYRYYSGVRIGATTICCSAIAVIGLLAGSNIGAQRSNLSSSGLALFPTMRQWSVTPEGGLGAPPGTDGRRVFVALADGHVTAYEAATGESSWTVAEATTQSPAAGEGAVVLVAGAVVTALDAETGRPLWRYSASADVAAPVTIAGGWVVVCSTDGSVAALRLADGSPVWVQRLEAAAAHSATLEGVYAFVPTVDGDVTALAMIDGALVWTKQLGGRAQPVLSLEDRIYVGSADNYFYCLRASDGRTEWRWRTGADIVGLAAYDERRVYVASMDNVLRAFDRTSGAQRWKRPLAVRPTAGPILVAEVLLVPSQGATLHGFSVRDGSSVGDIDTGSVQVGVPHVVSVAGVVTPVVVYASRSDVTGGAVAAVTRRIEPMILSPVAPLPNLVPPERLSPDGRDR